MVAVTTELRFRVPFYIHVFFFLTDKQLFHSLDFTYAHVNVTMAPLQSRAEMSLWCLLKSGAEHFVTSVHVWDTRFADIDKEMGYICL